MTGSEMVNSFQQLVETVSDKFIVSEKIPTYEVLDYLNRTVDRYIQLKYLSGDTFKSNVFKVSQSPDDWSNLMVNSTVGIGVQVEHPGIPNSNLITLPSNFMVYIRSSTLLSRTSPTQLAHVQDEMIPNVEIDYNDIDSLMTTPYNKPILVYPVVTMMQDPNTPDDLSYVVITDNYCTVTGISLDYIKRPTLINMEGNDCQLAIYLHEEIVKLAVSLYLDEYKLKLARTK